MISFELVQFSPKHINLIYQWRNDPTTRLSSFHQNQIGLEEFTSQFKSKYFSEPKLPPLFIFLKHEKVGIVYFERTNKDCRCLLSINIAPQHRQKKIATRALKHIPLIIQQQGYLEAFAEVKEDNIGAKKAFENAGFIDLGKTQKYLVDIDKTYTINNYLYSLAPNLNKTFIIAEAGANFRVGSYEKDLLMAKKLIDVAVSSGADAVKFQLYTAQNTYVSNAGKAKYLMSKATISEIFDDYALPPSFIEALYQHASSQGIEWMCSFFSTEDFEKINPFVKRHKIASYELTHIRLLELSAQSRKPLILSTGASNLEEIKKAVDYYYKAKGTDLTLLQCTAKYPASPSSMNLNTLSILQKTFNIHVGLSDHSRNPLYAPLLALGLGAKVIEKHFTLDNRLIGPDHFFAILPHELKEMVKAIRDAEQMLGTSNKQVLEEEVDLNQFCQRSLQAIKPIQPGDFFKEDKNYAILRSGEQVKGITPFDIFKVEGKKAVRFIPLGKGILEEDIAKKT